MTMICIISLVAIVAAASAQNTYDDGGVALPYYAQSPTEPASSYPQTYPQPNQSAARRTGLTLTESYPTKPYSVYTETAAPYSVYPPERSTNEINYPSYQISGPTTTTDQYKLTSSEESYSAEESTTPYPVYPEPAKRYPGYQTDKPAYEVTYSNYQNSESTIATEGYERTSPEESYPTTEFTTPYPVYPKPATHYPVDPTEKPAYKGTYQTYQASETQTNAEAYESPSYEQSYPTKESTTSYSVYPEPAKRYPIYKTDKSAFTRRNQIYQTSEPTTTTEEYGRKSSEESYPTKESATRLPVYPQPAKRYPVYQTDNPAYKRTYSTYQTSEPTTTAQEYKSPSPKKSYSTTESTRPYRIPSPTRKTRKPQY